MKGKQSRGLRQLSEEGTVQPPATLPARNSRAVGVLQFEVVKFRLEDEYSVLGAYESYPFTGMRWLKFKNESEKSTFISKNSSNIVYDHKERPCFGVRSEWDLKLVMEKFPDVEFFKNSDYR